MKEIKPIYDPSEDYEKSYGKADYKDKIILEIGADIGSTAYFFLTKGARKIISVEGNEKSYNFLLKNVNGMEEIVPVLKMIKSTDDIRELIREYKPNFLHMDCEYCERYLNGLEKEYFDNITTIQLEIHCDRELNKIILDCLLNMGYDIYEWTIIRGTNILILPENKRMDGDAWILLANKK
jgi:hypothetical protein